MSVRVLMALLALFVGLGARAEPAWSDGYAQVTYFTGTWVATERGDLRLGNGDGYRVAARQIEPGETLACEGESEFFPGVGFFPEYQGDSLYCYFKADTNPDDDEPPETVPINYGNTNHLLQACLVMGHAFALMLGYRSGDRI